MKRLIILVTVLAAGAFSIAAAGYQQPSQGLPAAALAATQIGKVKDNLDMITGAGPTDRQSVGSGKDRVDLYFFGRGHTNGDAWIVYTALRVMQTGDMFAWKDAPVIDRNNGGSGLEYAQTVGKVLATVKDVDTLIVGHSPLRKPSELQEYQRFMNDFVTAVRAANKAGKSVDEATASINLNAKYPGYRNDRYKPAVQAIYDELKVAAPN